MPQTVADRPWLSAYPEGVPADVDPPEEPLFAALARTAERFGDRPAVDFLGRVHSWRELHELVRRAQVMKGYWNRPEEAEKVSVDGRLRTGDVGTMDDDGYVYLVDRIKDLIIVHGYNVYPRIVEEALYEHGAVAEATVIGVPDPHYGRIPKAFVKLAEGKSVRAEEPIAFLKTRLSPYEVPREIEFRDSLPKTMIGKLSKKELLAEEMAKRRAAGRG